jgi:phytoene synthase
VTAAPDATLLRLEPGSPRQLSVLYAGAARRKGLEALYATEREIRSALTASSHEVAHVRQRFWREEVDRLVGGRPVHPLTQAMRAAPGGAALDFAPLHELLAATDLDLARFTYANRRELDAYAVRAGAAQRLAATLLAEGRPLGAQAGVFAAALGRLLRQTEMLAALQSEARAGRVYVPLEELQGVGVDPAEVHRHPAPPALLAWRRARAEELSTELRAAADPLSAGERRELLPSLVLGAQYSAWLGAIAAAEGRDVPVERVPTWRRVWTAWRSALRHG